MLGGAAIGVTELGTGTVSCKGEASSDIEALAAAALKPSSSSRCWASACSQLCATLLSTGHEQWGHRFTGTWFPVERNAARVASSGLDSADEEDGDEEDDEGDDEWA